MAIETRWNRALYVGQTLLLRAFEVDPPPYPAVGQTDCLIWRLVSGAGVVAAVDGAFDAWQSWRDYIVLRAVAPGVAVVRAEFIPPYTGTAERRVLAAEVEILVFEQG